MIKLIGIGMVLISCAALGSFVAEEKKKRLQSLRELRQFFLTLQGEIRYGGTPLKEAMEAAVGVKKEAMTGVEEREWKIGTLFLKIAEQMEERSQGGFYEIWEKEWLLKAKSVALEKRDLERLFRIGKTLGQLDRETQLESLKYYLSGIDQDIQAEERTIREKVRLCHWLGTLAGVFICILMI